MLIIDTQTPVPLDWCLCIYSRNLFCLSIAVNHRTDYYNRSKYKPYRNESKYTGGKIGQSKIYGSFY